MYYKRVQPFGLISLPCKWVILDNEIDQMKVKIQLNPTGIVLYYKKLLTIYVLLKKIIDRYLKTAISPQLQWPLTL